MALMIKDRAHFRDVVYFARTVGMMESLRKQLIYAATYACTETKRCACGGMGEIDTYLKKGHSGREYIPALDEFVPRVQNPHGTNIWADGRRCRMRCTYRQCDGTGLIKVFTPYLARYTLFPDRGPDFGFRVDKGGKHLISGGLIYFGPYRDDWKRILEHRANGSNLTLLGKIGDNDGWSMHS